MEQKHEQITAKKLKFGLSKVAYVKIAFYAHKVEKIDKNMKFENHFRYHRK
jgi:hypothetical protein